jgi:AcrR family transcriptional regulator
VEGLEGITIGNLAGALRMSKAGVIGQFGSKEELQLAALDTAAAIFTERIWDPASAKPEGIARLRAIARSWISYLEGDVFPGGCFLTAASTEFDGRPGRVRDEVGRVLARWHRALEREAAAAIEAGDLEGDAAQVAFEMNAVAMAVNQARQLRDDPLAGRRGRAAMKRILGP